MMSQQDPLVSHYAHASGLFNPAVAGMGGVVCFTALNRQQWVGLEGAPTTTSFTATTPLNLFGIRSGAGIRVVNDRIGFDNDISIALTYAYITALGPGTASFALRGGAINKTIDPDWQIPPGDGRVPPEGDPLIPVGKESLLIPDFDIGVLFVTESYYAGLSVTHLNRPDIKYDESGPYLNRHLYLNAGYSFTPGNPLFEIDPAMLFFTDGRAIQLTIGAVVTYNRSVWGGLAYRSGDAISGIAGVELYNGVRLGYAYDFSMTDIRRNTTGSHEFFVNYCFELGLGRSPGRYKSVRFL